MIWNLVQDTWKQVAAITRKQWDKLIADDFALEADRREQLTASGQKRHDVARHGADHGMSEKQRQDIEMWFAKD